LLTFSPISVNLIIFLFLGLFVVTNHTQKPRVFEIHGLSTTNLYTEFIQREGGPKVSLFEYYTQTYHIDFK